MSAYIVSDESINNIVNSFFWLRDNERYKEILKEKFKIDLEQIEDSDLEHELEVFGQALKNLNYSSVNQRYDRNNEVGKFEYVSKSGIALMQLLKSVQHFTYQSCEGDCDKTELYKFLIEFEHSLMWRIVGELKEYKEAKWE